ncbi:hypothetical protein LAZ67_5002129 [Cordylochernes scorpioides]|uniref:Uncharacterized protein n=1 Tax=Cordylochernes scorpioides TaxID=51811 RepID=A0ABY6KJ27_9ARAC|nr:hypothetical protein LAZ67_5002129 [Cordylochernes scorpioides]
MVELSELSYYRYCRITVCYLIGRRSGHRNMVELSPSVELGCVELTRLYCIMLDDRQVKACEIAEDVGMNAKALGKVVAAFAECRSKANAQITFTEIVVGSQWFGTKKKRKLIASAGKVTASLFWDGKGILLIDYFEKKKTELLQEEKKNLSPGQYTCSKKVYWPWENRGISSTIGSAIPHYSPDLAPSDFHFFPHLKKFVFEKHFGSNEEVERAVDEYFNGLSDSHFWEGILILETHWTECVEVKGDYTTVYDIKKSELKLTKFVDSTEKDVKKFSQVKNPLAVLSEKMEISSSDDSSSTSEDSLEPDVPRCEALKSLDVALKYLEKRTEPEMLASYNTINSLRTMLMREEEALLNKPKKQTTISIFFAKP